MNQKKDEKWLDELLRQTVDSGKVQFNAAAWKERFPREVEILKSGSAESLSGRPKKWGIIMKSRITKLAAAAVIIVVALIGVQRLGVPVDGAATALAQVAEAMKKVNWMHVVNKSSGGDTEEWYSFESRLSAIEKDGEVTYWDYGKDIKKYIYDPDANTITICDISGESFALGTETPLGMIERLIEMEQQRGAKLIRKAGQYEQIQAEIWEVTRPQGDAVETIQLFIDINRHLPLMVKVRYVDSSGAIAYEGDVRFEYPESGPRNIYDLGVPKTAKVVYLGGPSRELIEAAAEHDRRRRELGDFRGVTVFTSGEHTMFTVFEYLGSRNERRHSISGGLNGYLSRSPNELVESMVSGGWLESSDTTSQLFPLTIFPQNEIPLEPTMADIIRKYGTGGWKIVTSDDPELSAKMGLQLESHSGGGVGLHTWWVDFEHDCWVSLFTYKLVKAPTVSEGADKPISKMHCQVTAFGRTPGEHWYPEEIVNQITNQEGSERQETYRVYLEEIVDTATADKAFLERALSALLE